MRVARCDLINYMGSRNQVNNLKASTSVIPLFMYWLSLRVVLMREGGVDAGGFCNGFHEGIVLHMVWFSSSSGSDRDAHFHYRTISGKTCTVRERWSR